MAFDLLLIYVECDKKNTCITLKNGQGIKFNFEMIYSLLSVFNEGILLVNTCKFCVNAEDI